MALEVPDQFLFNQSGFDRNAALGRAAIEGFKRAFIGESPKASIIRAHKPPMDCFVDPQEALNPDNPHNLPHVARIFTIGIPFIEIRQQENMIPPNSMDVLIPGMRFHDCRLKDWDTYPNHGLHAAEWLEQHGKGGLTGALWEDLQFILIHHSDPVGTSVQLDEKYLYRLALLETMQDIDASELLRPGTPVTDTSQIALRTDLARQLDLPHISYALQKQVKLIQHPTGDIYEDQIRAAIELQLLNDE